MKNQMVFIDKLKTQERKEHISTENTLFEHKPYVAWVAPDDTLIYEKEIKDMAHTIINEMLLRVGYINTAAKQLKRIGFTDGQIEKIKSGKRLKASEVDEVIN